MHTQLPDGVLLCAVQVPAGGSAEYTLVYKPLTMTPAEGQPHEGSVFFPIPDGSGLLYKLYGQVRLLAVKQL
jgi:hydrocephalus-inducing protein